MCPMPLCAYVMGDRGALNEPATADDIKQMAKIICEARQAGAIGFSTSRTLNHKARDGEPVPGTFAALDELNGLADGLVAGGGGLFESHHKVLSLIVQFFLAKLTGWPISPNARDYQSLLPCCRMS